MTNDQQAYDRAMAHNAMLREALHDLYTEHPSTTWSEDVYVLKALNATEADAAAWQEAFSKKAVEEYLGAGAYADVCKQLATVTTERDCALAHVAMLVERLSRLKNILCAPFFVTKQEKSSGWHSTYSSLMNDIDGLIATTAPSTNLLLQRLERLARLDIINLVAREYQNCDSAEALVAKLQLHVQQNTNVEGNKQC